MQAIHDTLRSMRGVTLLPNVRFVQLQLASLEHSLQFLLGVASFCLLEVCLTWRDQSAIDDRPRQQTLLRNFTTILSLCPSFQTLYLTMTAASVDLRTLSDALHTCEYLRFVSLIIEGYHRGLGSTSVESGTNGDRLTELLTYLSSIPCLRELELRNGVLSESADHDTEVAITSPSLVFRDLTKVFVDVGPGTDAFYKALFTTCHFPILRSCVLRVASTLCSALPALLKSTVSVKALQTLHVSFWQRASVLIARIGFVELRPLSVFTSLQSLRIAGRDFTIELGDHHWESMARGWPHIRHFDIEDGVGGGDDNTVTVLRPSYKSLAHFVRLCPKLTQITLTLRDEHPLDTDELDSLPVSDRPIVLHLWHSTFRNFDPPARWIARMFPRLRLLTHATGYRVGYGITNPFLTYRHESWVELFDQVKSIRRRT